MGDQDCIVRRNNRFALSGRRSLQVLPGLLLLLLPAGTALANSQPEGRRVFTESLVRMPAEAATSMRAETAAGLSETMEIGFPLRMRNLQQLRDRTASEKVIPAADMERDYLPLRADYDAVVRWLAGEGFTITQTDPNRLCVFAKATLAQIQQSLQTEMVRVTVKGRDYHTARAHPSLPAGIAGPLLGVNGLQPFLKMQKHSPTSAYTVPYSVHDILTAYNGTGLAVTGAGQKIAILIDTFPSSSDVTTFWSNNGIPQSLANLEEINVNNVTLPSPTGEETLDVEWSSGMAPGAVIRVYAAGTLAFTDLDKALQRILSDLPTQPELHQLSISLGAGEVNGMPSQTQFLTDAQYLATIASGGVTVFVSSGDGGSNPSNALQVEYYASDPSVTGVGGTTLNMNGSGQVTGETTWTSSGGGTSVVFPRPAWQTGTGVTSGSMRLVPDVAFAGNPGTGGYVYFGGSVQTYGGTSWGAPSWAGICALINQARANAGLPPVGMLNPEIYPLIGTNKFRDITGGNNGSYSATAGYDEVSGIGSPNIANLVQALTIANPGAPVIGALIPASGTVSAGVGIGGLNFANVSAVTFNGVSAAFTVNSSTQITATVPSGATAGPVNVVTAAGTATSAVSFDVTTGPSSTLYTTGFETSEGYNNTATLAGQKGWTQAGSGGSGFLTNSAFSGAGYGEQAYIGYTAPSSGATESLWQPIGFTPGAGDLVNFSVLWSLIDSTKRNTHYDRFRWSVYNTGGIRLFSIEIDNASNHINYILDDNVTRLYGNFLTNNTIYSLQMSIDFTRNTWSATLDGAPMVSGQPVTTGSAARNLGSIRAEWLLNSTTAGNNYMLFDNYSITRTGIALPTFTVSTSALPAADGTTSGGGVIASGSSATLTAVPNPGYVFFAWLENSATASTLASYTFTVTSNRSLVAEFLPAAYSSWASQYYSPAQLAEPSVGGGLANPSGDGICNLLDYAFGLDPTMHNSQSALPQASVSADGYLVLTYLFNQYAADLACTVEVSSDLQTWNSGAGYTSAPVVLSDNGIMQMLQVTDLTPMSAGGNRFIRLRVVAQ